MIEKALLALLSAVAGGVFTYGTAGMRLEGRMEAVERTLTRIEARLFPNPATAQR